MQYTEEAIQKAKKVGAANALSYPKAKEGFWFDGIYIINILLDKTGREPLSFVGKRSERSFGRGSCLIDLMYILYTTRVYKSIRRVPEIF